MLPYELGKITPLNTRLCFYEYQEIKQSFLKESRTKHTSMCRTPYSRSLDTTSKTNDTSTSYDTRKSEDFQLNQNSTEPIDNLSKTPRNSSRKHASSFATLSSLIQQRKYKQNSVLQAIDKEKNSKPDYFKINKGLDDLFLIEVDPEAIDCNVHCKPSAVRSLEEYLNNPINLDININESKYLLEKYVLDVKDTKRKDISLSYLLSGIATDDSLHIIVAKEDELDEKKATLRQVLDKQIYSVQRSKEVDLNIIIMVDYFDMNTPNEKPVRGSVSSKQCVQRKFKTKKPIPSAQKPIMQTKPSVFAKVPPKLESKSDGASNSVKQSAAKTNQKNGISSFFNKATTSVNAKSVSEKTNVTSEAPKTVPVVSTQDRVNKLVDNESDSDQPIVKSQKALKTKENQKPKQSTKRSKKKNKDAPSPKRRKRIVQQESDSDDMFGSDSKDDIDDVNRDNSEEEEEIIKPKLNIPLAPKNKKRKLIDRTYTDDEGYVITKKEWIEESPSEDEIVPETPQKELKKVELKTEVKPNAATKKLTKSESSDLSDANNKDTKMTNGKAKGGKKGKKALAANQPTLMNFFKRA